MKLKKGMLYLMLSTVASTPFMAAANTILSSANAEFTGVINSTCSVTPVAGDGGIGKFDMPNSGHFSTRADKWGTVIVNNNEPERFVLKMEAPNKWLNAPEGHPKEDGIEFTVMNYVSEGPNNHISNRPEGSDKYESLLRHSGRDTFKVALNGHSTRSFLPGDYAAVVVVSCIRQ